MRLVLLMALLFAPVVHATSVLPPGYFKGHVRYVADGRYAYVEVDEKHGQVFRDGRPWFCNKWMVENGGLIAPSVEWRASGLYPQDDPVHPIWQGSLGCLYQNFVFVSDDGHIAAVSKAWSFDQAGVEFYRDGELVRSWTLPRAQESYHSTTATPVFGGGYSLKLVGETLRLMDNNASQLWFSMATGEYLGRSRHGESARRADYFATDDEMAKFEKALAGGIEEEAPAPDEGALNPTADPIAPPALPTRSASKLEDREVLAYGVPDTPGEPPHRERPLLVGAVVLLLAGLGGLAYRRRNT